MPTPYIVVRDGVVVQEITAFVARHAMAEKTEKGYLYALVWDDDQISNELDQLAESLPVPS